MRALKTVLAAAVVGCALAGTAVAMPAQQLAVPASALVQKTAWVCGPYRCWWRGPRYGWYGRPYYRPCYRGYYWRRRRW